jgi:CHAD domain-containing protein
MTMSNEHLIATHWATEKKKFDVNLSIIQQQVETNAIHDIRVSIKKLRAFWELSTLLHKEPPGNYNLNKTEQLFDVLGKHRDIHISIELLLEDEKDTSCSYSELRQYLQLLLTRTQAWVTQSVNGYDGEELPRILIFFNNNNDFDDGKEMVQHIRNIINSRLAAMRDFFKQPHKVRQNLKAVYYWAALLPQGSHGETIDTKMLHHILDELGDWQDNEMFMARIKHFRRYCLPKSFGEASLIKALEKGLKPKGEELRKSALSKARRLIRRV